MDILNYRFLTKLNVSELESHKNLIISQDEQQVLKAVDVSEFSPNQQSPIKIKPVIMIVLVAILLAFFVVIFSLDKNKRDSNDSALDTLLRDNEFESEVEREENTESKMGVEAIKGKRLTQVNVILEDGTTTSTYYHYNDITGLVEKISFSDKYAPIFFLEYDNENRFVKLDNGKNDNYEYVECCYDGSNRTTKLLLENSEFGSWEWDYTYDEEGNILTMSQESDMGYVTKIECRYNNKGQLIETCETSTFDEQCRINNYDYDEQGRVVSIYETENYGEWDRNLELSYNYDFDPLVICTWNTEYEHGGIIYYDFGILKDLIPQTCIDILDYSWCYDMFYEYEDVLDMEMDENGDPIAIEVKLGSYNSYAKYELVYTE